MNLVYAKNSDEIGCVFRVCFTCFYMQPQRVVQSYLMYLASRIVWQCLYESLLTYVAYMVLVGDPLQGTCHARASKILITKMRKIFYLGFGRILTQYVASTYLDLRAITRYEAVRSGDDRQARHCLLQRLAFSETCHNWDIFPANTMAYDTLPHD